MRQAKLLHLICAECNHDDFYKRNTSGHKCRKCSSRNLWGTENVNIIARGGLL